MYTKKCGKNHQRYKVEQTGKWDEPLGTYAGADLGGGGGQQGPAPPPPFWPKCVFT